MGLQESLVQDRVGDLGLQAPVTVAPDMTIGETIALMQRERIGCVIVASVTKMVGIFTERDVLKRVLAEGVSLKGRIESVMTPDPSTLSLSDCVADVIRKMHAGGFRHMPVVDESGKVSGVVSVKRVVQFLVEHFPEAVYNLPPDPTVIATSREGS